MPQRDPIAIFQLVTGQPPYDYQRVLCARALPPQVVEVPTGSGKTLAALIPWLCDAHAPRRLVYALPMRSLVEQTARVVRDALEAAGDPDVAVHVLMGGVEDAGWRAEPERRAVLVGTIDMLLSRALGRGYGESRYAWPVSFGLLNSDCRWVFDEVQLMGPARTTSAQLAGLRTAFGTTRECQTTWMSATVDHEALRTVDHDLPTDVVRLSEADRAGPLALRLDARKEVVRLDLVGTPPNKVDDAIDDAVLERHATGTRTIVVLNRVDAAQRLHDRMVKRLAKATAPPAVVLLHSRFRPVDRADQMTAALAEPDAAGTIVVATQVIEAGVDVSCALLVTATAPFSAMVQRLGRCNRAGELDAATVLWLDQGTPDAKAAAPYAPEDLAAAREAFLKLVGESASPARLEQMQVPEVREPTSILRRRDLLDLFDTAPDLSGADVDISPLIRPDDGRTVSVFFRALGESPAASQPAATRDELVSVPIAEIEKAKRNRWAFDHVDGVWVLVRGTRRVVPGQVVMLDAADGGYAAAAGWTGKAKDVPTVLAPLEPVSPEGMGSDVRSVEEPAWVTVVQHLADAHGAARDLAAALGLSAGEAEAGCRAAALHDVGKVHDAFQQMLLGTVKDGPARVALAEGGPWAKSGLPGGRHVRPFFRHELASALLLAHASPDLVGAMPTLVRYLVAAHHGRVRLSIRPAPGEEPPGGHGDDTRFALGVVEGDVLPDVETPLGALHGGALDLAEMELGGGGSGRSWTAEALELLDAHGPFRLAYLEMIVRIADWRASA